MTSTRRDAWQNGTGSPAARVGDQDLVESRRAQIVEAATRLFARKGFSKTVVRDIAVEADISVGLIYEYVRTKDDILFLVFRHWTSVWRDAVTEAVSVPGTALERIERAIRLLVDLTAEHADVTHLFSREIGSLTSEYLELTKSNEREIVGKMVAVINDGIAVATIRDDIDAVGAAMSILLLANGWALKGYIVHADRSKDKYATMIFDMCIGPWLSGDRSTAKRADTDIR